MKEYKQHLIACNGSDCKKKKGGKKLLKKAKKRLDKDARFVKFSKVSCLGQCKQGPILIVYPDGVWYTCQNKKALKRIIKEHVIKGDIAEEQVLFKML